MTVFIFTTNGDRKNKNCQDSHSGVHNFKEAIKLSKVPVSISEYKAIKIKTVKAPSRTTVFGERGFVNAIRM